MNKDELASLKAHVEYLRNIISSPDLFSKEDRELAKKRLKEYTPMLRRAKGSRKHNASVIQRGGKYYFKSFMGETGPYRSEPEAWRRGWTTAFKERNPAPKVKQGKWTPVHAVRFRRDGGVDLMY